MKHNEEAEQVPEAAMETGSGWPVLEIGRHKKGGLVEQIVIAISVMVGSRALRIGTRMPSADTSRRGLALKSRLLVNGIQNADIDSGLAVWLNSLMKLSQEC